MLFDFRSAAQNMATNEAELKDYLTEFKLAHFYEERDPDDPNKAGDKLGLGGFGEVMKWYVNEDHEEVDPPSIAVKTFRNGEEGAFFSEKTAISQIIHKLKKCK